MNDEQCSTVDPYSHPAENVLYTEVNLPGKGRTWEDISIWLTTSCSCDKDCGERCECLKAYGISYVNGALAENLLSNERFVIECGPMCRCRLNCTNALVQHGPNPDLCVKEVDNKGYGLFTNKTMTRGTFVCEYVGEILGREEALKRYRIGEHRKYMFCLAEYCTHKVIETYIDATRYANIGRYVNHSCSPNCVVVPVRAGVRTPRLALFANRTINENEEITYAYGPVNSELSSVRCFCGDANCRGFLPRSALG